ncbi:MFS transporter superfamily protein [Pleurotus pulmonarius]
MSSTFKPTDDQSSDLVKIDQEADVENLQEDRATVEKRMLFKLDLRMSYLIVLYILNIIDRGNTPAARLRGFEKELGLEGTEYSTVLSIFFVGYILMQIPSNMLMNYLGRPSIYLPICTMGWGLISALTGVANDFVGVLLCRFFLGFVEAAFLPGALFLLSQWYKREELGVRVTILFCATFLSGAFGSVMAAGILNGMEGKLGHSAWRWLFFLEGSITVFLAIFGMFVLPDFPSNSSSWLTPAEKAVAELRMEEEARGHQKSVGYMQGFILAISDWKVWWLSTIMGLIQLSLSFMTFFPTLTATLGYNLMTTLLLCAPPWVLTTISAFLVTRHSDRTKERCFHTTLPLVVGIIGSIIAMCTMNTAARYVSLFLMAQSPMGPAITIAWCMTSLQPANKTVVGIALINAMSQIGLVIGPYAWDQSWGPSYRKSFAICLAAAALSIVMSFVFRYHLAGLNAKAEKEERDRGQTEPGFRYML